MEESSKHIYKTIFGLVKKLDEHRKSISSAENLFSHEAYERDRRELIEKCELLILGDFEALGRKSREVLWRKCYYEPITICRKIGDDDVDLKKQVREFLNGGILQLKKLVLTFDEKFELGLKDTINLDLIRDNKIILDPIVREQFTMNEICYAWDIVHLTVVALGDMYRYYLNFRFDDSVVDREFVAQYYREAFKLNPSSGLSQNQLGTLYSGHNHEIDSIFHYLFALTCKEPSDLSEANVSRIFQKNALMLEKAENLEKIKGFAGRFILVVDIFYYDKDVTDFTDLCHSFLMDLKFFLDGSDSFFSEDVLFKITAILLFCLEKLRSVESKKVHSMNAVLVALTAEYVEHCNRNFELFKSCKEAQNLIFNERYNRVYSQFEDFVRSEKLRPKEEQVPKITTASQTPESGSSNKENASRPASQSAPSEKSKGKRRANRRRRGPAEDSSDSEDEDPEKFHFSDSESDVSFESFDSDDSSDDERESKNGLESDSGDDIIILEDEIIPIETPQAFKSPDNFALSTPFEQLSGVRFRKSYKKIDPNIVVEFSRTEKTLKALKILFDWLDTAQDVLLNCYTSNPEFIHKIMRLINFLNIDIFTRRVYFDRSFLHTPDMREDLRHLFDIRNTIPVTEDVELKQFQLLSLMQAELDWELPAKLQITPNENGFLRLFKVIDFGFHLAKTRKFHYFFCAKSRTFIEKVSAKERHREEKKQKRERNDRKRVVEQNQRKNRGERRGYLKNRNRNRQDELTNKVEDLRIMDLPLNGKTTSEKMGELWLRSEVKLLEKKVNKEKATDLEPTLYVVIDTKALVGNTAVVKELVGAKKFVVLIPSAVLSDLDELKKGSRGVRETIEWLEQQFTKGNRFIRSQRPHETLPLTLLKIPKKLEREASRFMQVVQFCNYMVTKNEGMITLLTGENLANRCYENFSCCGILNAIPVKFDQITNFHAKFKHKK